MDNISILVSFIIGLLVGGSAVGVPVWVINKNSKSKNDIIDKMMDEMKLHFENTANKIFKESSQEMSETNKEKLEEFKSHFGYYQIVTSEINMPVTEVIEKYHGLTRIEDQFRVMKSDLETRPVYVRTKEHIEAHLLICLIALTMIRMIQCKICRSGLVPKSDDITLWSMGLPAYRIQRALKKWNVELFADNLYRFTNLDDPDLKLIMDSFDIHIPAKLFNKTALKSQIKNINMEI